VTLATIQILVTAGSEIIERDAPDETQVFAIDGAFDARTNSYEFDVDRARICPRRCSAGLKPKKPRRFHFRFRPTSSSFLNQVERKVGGLAIQGCQSIADSSFQFFGAVEGLGPTSFPTRSGTVQMDPSQGTSCLWARN
jgi:hypothetical protein